MSLLTVQRNGKESKYSQQGATDEKDIVENGISYTDDVGL